MYYIDKHIIYIYDSLFCVYFFSPAYPVSTFFLFPNGVPSLTTEPNQLTELLDLLRSDLPNRRLLDASSEGAPCPGHCTWRYLLEKCSTSLRLTGVGPNGWE